MNKEDRKDLVERLRGIYRIPITDGLGPAGGEEPDNPNEFVRTFPSPPIQIEAAAEIDRLRRELEEARKALRQMRCPRPCNHQPEDLDAGDCIDAGECGCIDSQYLASLRAGEEGK
ncbi:hypothetical protein [Sinorhizobium meliloti]|uniref:hypothetical protein n=1 Tax=Rhizobium meliloti TaxID=382 RepID=UPI0012972F2A|nr:hypothetical protein [Sinorhizobium meliloti]MQX28963.1 hypothetical protein [Sinorhizobium meliloti]